MEEHNRSCGSGFLLGMSPLGCFGIHVNTVALIRPVGLRLSMLGMLPVSDLNDFGRESSKCHRGEIVVRHRSGFG